MCLYALYGRIQVGVRPDIFLPITSQIIYVVRLMSGSCHARFLVVYDFSCPARVSLIPALFRLSVLFQLGSLPLCPVLLVFGQCYARVRLKCLAEFMLPFGQTFSYGYSALLLINTARPRHPVANLCCTHHTRAIALPGQLIKSLLSEFSSE